MKTHEERGRGKPSYLVRQVLEQKRKRLRFIGQEYSYHFC